MIEKRKFIILGEDKFISCSFVRRNSWRGIKGAPCPGSRHCYFGPHSEQVCVCLTQ